MPKITEMIPDNMPEWAREAMVDGQLFNITFGRIRVLEEKRSVIVKVSDLKILVDAFGEYAGPLDWDAQVLKARMQALVND